MARSNQVRPSNQEHSPGRPAPLDLSEESNFHWAIDNLTASPLGTALTLSAGVTDRLNVLMWGYPEWRDVYIQLLPFIKDFVILLGGAIGTYYILGKKDKLPIKRFLRGVPVTFAFTELIVQAGYNEIWPDQDAIPNDWFYLGICGVGILAGILAGYRLPYAHHFKGQEVCKKPAKKQALWLLDVLLRGFYYATILSAGFLYSFDHFVYTEDVNKSFQRAWEASLLGFPISFAQAFIKEDRNKKDHSLVLSAIMAGFIYKVVSRLARPQDPILLGAEIAIWGALAIGSLIMLYNIAKNHPKISESWANFWTPRSSIAGTPVSRSRSVSSSGSQDSIPSMRGLPTSGSLESIPEDVPPNPNSPTLP